MNIEIQDVIKLDDKNEYVVVSKADFEQQTYVYIVDINNNTKFKIAKVLKDKLVEVDDNKELIRELIVLFYKNAINAIDVNALVRNQINLAKK
ncbi:MAG: hypothetical protein PHH71_03220 [Clostridia bacterium]|jgi:hypothetical protein|nr:hypothetical protein [Clostridia bacterium]MDD3232059.1 hypothetical protein [Clostridia bacterium]MDD4408267.1 hypothetical protein [Clostridia bacterium]